MSGLSPYSCGVVFADDVECDLQPGHGGNSHSGIRDGKRVWAHMLDIAALSERRS